MMGWKVKEVGESCQIGAGVRTPEKLGGALNFDLVRASLEVLAPTTYSSSLPNPHHQLYNNRRRAPFLFVFLSLASRFPRLTFV